MMRLRQTVDKADRKLEEEIRRHEGETVDLQVTAEDFSPGSELEFLWTKNEAEIRLGARFGIHPLPSGSRLRLADLSTVDTGVYRCEVVNSHEAQSSSFSLTVEECELSNIHNFQDRIRQLKTKTDTERGVRRSFKRHYQNQHFTELVVDSPPTQRRQAPEIDNQSTTNNAFQFWAVSKRSGRFSITVEPAHKPMSSSPRSSTSPPPVSKRPPWSSPSPAKGKRAPSSEANNSLPCLDDSRRFSSPSVPSVPPKPACRFGARKSVPTVVPPKVPPKSVVLAKLAGYSLNSSKNSTIPESSSNHFPDNRIGDTELTGTTESDSLSLFSTSLPALNLRDDCASVPESTSNSEVPCEIPNDSSITAKAIDDSTKVIGVSDDDVKPSEVPDDDVKPSEVPDDDVKSSEVPDDDVKPFEVSDDKVRSSEVSDDTVTSSEAPADDVKPSDTHKDTVKPSEELDDALRPSEVFDDNVRLSERPDDTVIFSGELDDALRPSEVSDDALRPSEVSDDSVRPSEVPDDSVRLSEVPKDIVKCSEVSGETVKSSEIPDDDVRSPEISHDSTVHVDIPDDSTTPTVLCNGTDPSSDHKEAFTLLKPLTDAALALNGSFSSPEVPVTHVHDNVASPSAIGGSSSEGVKDEPSEVNCSATSVVMNRRTLGESEKLPSLSKDIEEESEDIAVVNVDLRSKSRDDDDTATISHRKSHGSREADDDTSAVMSERPTSMVQFRQEQVPKEEIPFPDREVELKTGVDPWSSYEQFERIGSGGFSEVFRCREISTGLDLAAKVARYRSSNKPSLMYEIDILRSLCHPRIMRLYDVYDYGRRMYLITEYIGGGELCERIIEEDFLSEEQACNFILQILRGVTYLHKQSIIHLDLKPENIVCTTKSTYDIKIIDFGFAQKYEGEHKPIHFLGGTANFTAPEVINYDPLTFAADVWAVGVMAYLLLCGYAPFDGDSDQEVLVNVTKGIYDYDDDIFEQISPSAREFIDKILVKNPSKRPTSQQLLRDDWLRARGRRSTIHIPAAVDHMRTFVNRARDKWKVATTAIMAMQKFRRV